MEPNSNGPTPVWVYSNACHHFTVPPPRKYEANNSSYHSIEDFFFYYENYAAYQYGVNRYVWLQILPEFLGGFVKEVVLEHGLGVNVDYERVKAKVVVLAKHPTDIEQWQHNFLNLSRDASEPVTSFVGRLEIKVASFPGMPDSMRRGLVRERLLRLLPDNVIEYLRATLGTLEEVATLELAQLVQLYETSGGRQPEWAEPSLGEPNIVGVSTYDPEGVIPPLAEKSAPIWREEKPAPHSANIPLGQATGPHRSLRRPRCWVCRSRRHLRVDCPTQKRSRLVSRATVTGANAIPVPVVSNASPTPEHPRRPTSVGGDSIVNLFRDSCAESNRTLTPLAVGRLSREALSVPGTSTPIRSVAGGLEHTGTDTPRERDSNSVSSSADNGKIGAMLTENSVLDWSYCSDWGFSFPNFKDYLQISLIEGTC